MWEVQPFFKDDANGREGIVLVLGLKGREREVYVQREGRKEISARAGGG